ncbi:hypothetical protein [Phenylobacterium sp.]|jgi:hypothetical protein|uniref:hypothetical protein n=1 Tax=Phenylobacterium sp. TaxID=1871053 RepID=UPI002E367B24|nr:hypothetical protein [Phenylobacterium sp.]HEX2559508.1 hypothetical protein [Phenylobacterium sp.]
MPAPHTETALHHIRRIVTIAAQPGAPITRQEAFEQIIEELELAGFCPDLGDGAGADAPAEPARRTN